MKRKIVAIVAGMVFLIGVISLSLNRSNVQEDIKVKNMKALANVDEQIPCGASGGGCSYLVDSGVVFIYYAKNK